MKEPYAHESIMDLDKWPYYLFLLLLSIVSGMLGVAVFRALAPLATSWDVLAMFLVTAGLSLIVEHKLKWGYLKFELFGHETYGALLILTGLLTGLFSRKKKNSHRHERRLRENENH